MLNAVIDVNFCENTLRLGRGNHNTMLPAQPILNLRPRRILPILVFFLCLPSLFASGMTSGLITTPSGGFISSGSLTPSFPAPMQPDAVGT